MSQSKIHAHREGFTLLEVLLAMAILGVGVLTIGLAQLSAIKMSARSNCR